MIAPLRRPHFLNLLFGAAVITTGFWMQAFAQGWLVVQIAIAEGAPERAPFYLGIVSIARAGPGIALSLYGGALADRLDRRRMLLWSNAVSGVISFGLAALTIAGLMNVPLLVVFSALSAAAGVFDGPTRMAMLPRLVPPRELIGAIGATQVVHQTAGIIGPLLGGLLLLPFGAGGVFLVRTITQVVCEVLTFKLPPQPPVTEGPPQSAFAAILEGIRFLRNEPVLRPILLGSLCIAFTLRPLQNLLPSVTANVLHVGALELSWLLAAVAMGSLSAALGLIVLGRFERLGFLYAALWASAGLLQLAFALQREFGLALVLLFFTSFALMSCQFLASSMVQLRTPNHLLGRVMSMQNMNFNGVMPIGTMAIGTVATVTGIDWSLVGAGIVAVGLALGAFLVSPALRGWRVGDRAVPE